MAGSADIDDRIRRLRTFPVFGNIRYYLLDQSEWVGPQGTGKCMYEKGAERRKENGDGKESLQNYEELPLMLTVLDVAVALGVGRAGAYELAHSEGFPVLKVGSRIVIPRDKFLLWIEKQCGGES